MEPRKSFKLRKSSVADKEARKALAPFLYRIKRKKLHEVIEHEDLEEHVFSSKIKFKELIPKLASFYNDRLDVPSVVNETCEILKYITKSLGGSSYIVNDNSEYLILNSKYMPQNGRHRVTYKIESGKTLASYVAYSKKFVMSDDILGDSRFPLGIPDAGATVKSALCIPVMTGVNGKCNAVIELYRGIDQESYGPFDLQICVSMAGWMGAAIHQNKEKNFLLRKSELTIFLMSLLEIFFAESITFDKFISDIIECAKLSVQGERGMFYIMDEEVIEGSENDVVADVYEEGLDSTHHIMKKKNKQKFTQKTSGFADFVARSGRPINIRDTYKEPKFSKSPDWNFFIAKCMIGIPLKGSKGVKGVLLLINKKQEPYFNEKDEILLKEIAKYATLACQHYCLKDHIQKLTCRIKGTEELVKLHLKPCPDDLRYLRYIPFFKKSDLPKGFFNFDWIITGKEELATNFAVFMFIHLLGDQYFDYYSLTEFILSAKKSYRDNPYHNFSHAFTVCHCAFNIIMRNKDSFTKIETVSFLIATICHDSDHVGYTNNFLEMNNHWLSQLYWESPLEYHHYEVCLLIIEASKLFANIKLEEVEEICKLIKFLILSTDLVQYFRTRGQVVSILKDGSFNLKNKDHQLMFFGIIMTVCDVSGQCKPFYSAKKVTEGLYREFYNQGDEEKSLGFSPLALMDREKTSNIPENQIQFLSLVCIPSVEILTTVFPNTNELLRQCIELKDCWSDIQTKKVVKVWKWEECIVKDKTNEKRISKKLLLQKQNESDDYGRLYARKKAIF